MKRLLIIGCGDVGLRAARMLLGRYHRVHALVRDPAKAERLRTLGILPLHGDLDQPDSLVKLGGLAHDVLHFAPPQNHGAQDLRTRHLLAALCKAEILPHRLVYISTSGVYGHCHGDLVPETRRINPTNARAVRRADAEQQLRRWGARCGVAVSILRAPGIYARGRLPLERLKAGTPALAPEDDGYTNHIHAEDLARVAVAALVRGRAGRIYNVVDDSHLKMADYFDLVADRFDLPRPPRVSWAEAQGRIPESLLSFMSESRRLVNTRMKRELGVKLAYADVQAGMLKD
jgi:nucleoside-diphosphate-sugar epimerase